MADYRDDIKSTFLSDDIEVNVTLAPFSSNIEGMYPYLVIINAGTADSEVIFTGNRYFNIPASTTKTFTFYLNDILANYKWNPVQMLPPYSTSSSSVHITTKVQVVINSQVLRNASGYKYVSLLYDYPNKKMTFKNINAFKSWNNWAAGATWQYNLLQGYSLGNFNENQLAPRIPYVRDTTQYPLIWTVQNNATQQISAVFDGRLSGSLTLSNTAGTIGNKCNIVPLDNLFDAAEEERQGYVNQFYKNILYYTSAHSSNNTITWSSTNKNIIFTTANYTEGSTYNIYDLIVDTNNVQYSSRSTTFRAVNGYSGHFEHTTNTAGTTNLFFRLGILIDNNNNHASLTFIDYTFSRILNLVGLIISYDYEVNIENNLLTLIISNIHIDCIYDYFNKTTVYYPNNGLSLNDIDLNNFTEEFLSGSSVGLELELTSRLQVLVESGHIKVYLIFFYNNILGSKTIELCNLRDVTFEYFSYEVKSISSLEDDIEEIDIVVKDTLLPSEPIIASAEYYKNSSMNFKSGAKLYCPLKYSTSDHIFHIRHPKFQQLNYRAAPNVDYGMVKISKTDFVDNWNLWTFYTVANVDMCPAKYYLLWQDRYSGFQSQPFEKGSIFSESLTSTEITNYKNERRKIQSDVQPKWEINTSWLDENLYPYYESIFVSPYLVLYDTEEDTNYVVICTDKEYTEKTFKNQNRKMFNLKLKLELNKKQRLLY